MESGVQRGYLLLADLSGYTRFVAGTELEHAQGILGELLTLVIAQLTPTLTLAEVEGDAVYAYAPVAALSRGEALLELIEVTYVAFRDRQRSMQRSATCPCRACQAIHTLDLKFVTHCGDYFLQEVAGARKPVGSCVNLVHRLLKNHIGASTGWRAYALFTAESLRSLGIAPEGMHRQAERYEHLGEVDTHSLDLDLRYRQLTGGRRVVLGPEEAHVTLTHHFPFPPPVVWDWLTDPHKRNLWMKNSAWRVIDRPGGRTRSGAQNHCTISHYTEHILDWRPFDYFTVRYARGETSLLMTGRLSAAPAGTRVHWTMRLEGGFPRWILRPACGYVARRYMELGPRFALAERLMHQAAAEVEARERVAS